MVHRNAAMKQARRPRRNPPAGMSSRVLVTQVHPAAMAEARRISAGGRRIVCLDARTVLVTNQPA
jgi:hypothetical protein